MIETIFGDVDEELMGSNVRKIRHILDGSQAKDSVLALLFICKECVEQGIDKFPNKKNDFIDGLQASFDVVIEQLEEYEPNSEDEA